MTNTLQFSFRRLGAFLLKEFYQVFRDPSCILIAFVLPLLLLFLFGYGVSLDANTIRIGIVLEDSSPEARLFTHVFTGSKYFDVTLSTNRRFLIDEMIESRLRGVIIIPENFSTQTRKQGSLGELSAPGNFGIQIIADGAETNTASFVQNYAEGALQSWIGQLRSEGFQVAAPPIVLESRTWFNPELRSRYTLLSGSIAITMALIGILLTALVVAREWERGTMESILSTPILISEFLLGKLIPYMVLGLGSMTLCVLISTTIFGVPFLGSYLLLFLSTTVFLIAGLGTGLLISTGAKNQFVAIQLSFMLGFLPSFMLSGFIYEISSMPMPIQMITYLLPARYFVSILQTIFLAGNVASVIVPNLIFLGILSTILLIIIRRKIAKRLE